MVFRVPHHFIVFMFLPELGGSGFILFQHKPMPVLIYIKTKNLIGGLEIWTENRALNSAGRNESSG